MLASKLLSFHKNARGRSSQHGRVHDSFIKRICQCYISLKRKRKENETFLSGKRATYKTHRSRIRGKRASIGTERVEKVILDLVAQISRLILLVILSFSFCHCSDECCRTSWLFLYWVIKACMLWPVKRRHLRFEAPHIRRISDMFIMLKMSTLTPLLREVFMHRDKYHLNVWQMHRGRLYVTSSINRILNIFHNKMRIMHLELIELYR